MSEFLIQTYQDDTTINNGKINFIDAFALFLAGIIVFKFIFALIYITKWNYRNTCKPYYGKGKIDIDDQFR